MIRKLYAAAVMALLVAVAPLTVLATHDTDPTVENSTPEANNETYWENLGYGECTKLDEAGTGPVTLSDPSEGFEWTLLLFKQARENIYWTDPTPGHPYYSGLEWSHRITCLNTTTTTTTEETTSTDPSTTSSSSTSSSTSTTAPSTTSTSSDQTTTTSTSSTSTTENSTTTSNVESTTSSTDELPFTGGNSGMYALLAVSLLALGTALIRSAKDAV